MTPKGIHVRLLCVAWALRLQQCCRHSSQMQSREALPLQSTHHPWSCCLQLVLMVGSSGEAARSALEHGPGEVPSAATVVSELQDLAANGDPDSMYEAAACLDALQTHHAGVLGNERTDLAQYFNSKPVLNEPGLNQA